jgi:hypothetical protein
MSKPTFKWNLDNGEGSIGNLEKFRLMDPLLRLDLLQDWIHDLSVEYKIAHQEFDKQLKRIRKNANRP